LLYSCVFEVVYPSSAYLYDFLYALIKAHWSCLSGKFLYTEQDEAVKLLGAFGTMDATIEITYASIYDQKWIMKNIMGYPYTCG
jgi:hypothetical protein